MPKLLVLANLELSFEFDEACINSEELVRAKERRLLHLLRKLAREGEPGIEGSLERLEYESFTYHNEFESDSSGYYYNKHEKRAGAQ
jgi:hypothetical protein